MKQSEPRRVREVGHLPCDPCSVYILKVDGNVWLHPWGYPAVNKGNFLEFLRSVRAGKIRCNLSKDLQEGKLEGE